MFFGKLFSLLMAGAFTYVFSGLVIQQFPVENPSNHKTMVVILILTYILFHILLMFIPKDKDKP